jgi:hypothetical protein
VFSERLLEKLTKVSELHSSPRTPILVKLRRMLPVALPESQVQVVFLKIKIKINWDTHCVESVAGKLIKRPKTD